MKNNNYIQKEFLIVLSVYYKENFSENIAVNLNQPFSKTTEHNQAYIDNMLELLRKTILII